jgi:hypothetical protein
MKLVPSLLAVALAGSTATAFAQDENRRGAFIGVGAGQFNLDIDGLDDLDEAAETVRESDDNTWKLFAGFRFTRWLSVEAAYIDLGSPGDSFDASGSDGNYRIEMSGFAPAVIGTVPIGPIEIFGKIGRYFYDVDTRIDFDAPGPDLVSSNSREDTMWGAGISGVVLKRLELRGEYQKIDIDNAEDSDAFWLSAAWRF